MLNRFRYLDNLGSPTKWDGTRYFRYLRRIDGRLEPEVRDLVSPQRYDLSGPRSMRDALLIDAQFRTSGVGENRVSDLDLVFLSDSEVSQFHIACEAVAVFETEAKCFRFPPVLIAHELVLVGNGWMRLAMSDLGGAFYVAVCRRVSFKEVRVLRAVSPLH